jgi:mRNA interferase YafQ
MASPPNPSSSKRTNPPRRSDYTKQFIKDWHQLTRAGRYNMRQLKEVMLLLIANEGPLPSEWRDHELSHGWADHRECHVAGDFLLIYQLDERSSSVIFIRAGTHAELFE